MSHCGRRSQWNVGSPSNGNEQLLHSTRNVTQKSMSLSLSVSNLKVVMSTANIIQTAVIRLVRQEESNEHKE